MRCPCPVVPMFTLALLVCAVPAAAQQPANFVIICADQSWIPAFSPLESYLEADWDWEGDRPWSVEVIALSDSSAVRGALASYYQALQQSGGGDLFAMIVEDPSASSLIQQRMIYDPEVAGADLGWGDYVPSDDLYCDLDDDGVVEVITFRLPAQSIADCETYVEKDLNVRFNLAWSLSGAAGRASSGALPHEARAWASELRRSRGPGADAPEALGAQPVGARPAWGASPAGEGSRPSRAGVVGLAVVADQPGGPGQAGAADRARAPNLGLRLPRAVQAEPALQPFYQKWAAKAPQSKATGRHGALANPGYLFWVDVICEDYDRGGRSGQLVRQHGQSIVDLWSGSSLYTYYQGDDHPFDYFAREADADSLDNWGHQFKFTLGTIANKVNLINFQDQRQDPPWGVGHLNPNYCFPLHVALSCAHHAIDRPDNYGRPHAEQVAFLADRGAFASLGYTRQVRQWSAYWMGEALSNVLIPRLAQYPYGVTVGRAWRDAKNSFRAAHPEHATECASFSGLGDPTLCVVAPGILVTAPHEPPPPRPTLTASPNPFSSTTTIRYALPTAQRVELAVYDAAGRKVRDLVPRSLQPAGQHGVAWDGRNDRGTPLPSGVYFVRLAGKDGVVKTTKLVILK